MPALCVREGVNERVRAWALPVSELCSQEPHRSLLPPATWFLFLCKEFGFGGEDNGKEWQGTLAHNPDVLKDKNERVSGMLYPCSARAQTTAC